MSTWMVVEDEPDIYEVLLTMFEMWGIEGVAFVDGEETVAWIDDVDQGRFQGELPELALLDIRLPGELDGIQVGERLRRSDILGDIAIVMTTAYRLTPEEQEEAMTRTGADKWLPKPLPKFNVLQSILEEVIADRRARSGTTNTGGLTPRQGSHGATDSSTPAESVESAPFTTPNSDEKTD